MSISVENGNLKYETVMDVTEEQLARVYAKAFLRATSATAGQGLVDELSSIVSEVLNRFPKFDQTLRSSLVSPEQKEELLGRVFGGKVSPDVLNFLKVLSRHGRLGLIRQTSRLVKKLFDEQSGKQDVEVRVASELDDSTRNEIQAQLRKLLNAEPVITVKVDPALLAGIVIRVGDRVYDGSVQTQLEHTRAAMIARATEQIETRPERFATTT